MALISFSSSLNSRVSKTIPTKIAISVNPVNMIFLYILSFCYNLSVMYPNTFYHIVTRINYVTIYVSRIIFVYDL